MDWRMITGIVCGAAGAVLLIYDGIVIWKTNDQMSISQFIWDLSAKRPIVPFFGGFICGHFWFR